MKIINLLESEVISKLFIFQFDLLDQGKFRKMGIFDMNDSEMERKFRGKAFLFEHTVLCTEFADKSERPQKLSYRTHMVIDDINFIDTNNKDAFKFVTMNGREVEFYTEHSTFQEWMKILTSIEEKGNKLLKN